MAHITKNTAKFYSKLNEFRNLGKYSDVTIVCEQTSFQCHRVVLATTCPYFDSMFSLQLQEKKGESVELPEMKAAIFREVLQFIYTGDAAIDSDNIFNLIIASDFLNLEGLEELCMQYLGEEGSAMPNILDMLSFAYASNKDTLVDVLADHVIKNFKLFIQSEDFLEISFKFLSKVLLDQRCSGKFGILTYTEAVENYIIDWINHSREERSQYIYLFLTFDNLNACRFFESLPWKSTDECVELPEKPSYENLVSENKNVMNLFLVQKKEMYEFDLNRSWVQVYELYEDLDCYATCEVAHKKCTTHEMKCVAINNSCLFCLNYYSDQTDNVFKFSVCPSVNGQSENILKSPPWASPNYELCNIRETIFFYDQLMQKNGIYFYRKDLDDWFPVPQMKDKKKMASVTACSDTNLLYVIGGSEDLTSSNSAYAYDHRTGEWQKLPETFSKRSAAACCLYKGKLYLCGGHKSKKDPCEIYDPVAGRWDKFKPMNKEVIHHRMMLYKNALWVVGGRRNGDMNHAFNTDIDKYDPVVDEWCTSSQLGKIGGFPTFKVLDGVVFKPYL